MARSSTGSAKRQEPAAVDIIPDWLSSFRQTLKEAVFNRPSTDTMFNQYRDAAPGVDVEDAQALRRGNLVAYLRAYPVPPGCLIVGEAPGPWGCRFSGVPITSEAQLLDPDFPLQGTQTSVGDRPLTEYSAGIFWRAMAPGFPHFLFWNTVPWHPHKPGAMLSIRTPTVHEVREGTAILAKLCEAMRPVEILALGRKAEGALRDIGLNATYVRHPSQGGARLFTDTMRDRVARLLTSDGSNHG